MPIVYADANDIVGRFTHNFLIDDNTKEIPRLSSERLARRMCVLHSRNFEMIACLEQLSVSFCSAMTTRRITLD